MDEYPAAVLPDDVFQEEVLHRLPPRGLAVCRSVCKAWRAVIDARRMLRPDLLPLWPCGIFLNLGALTDPPELFAPPYVGRKVASNLERYTEKRSLEDISSYCNGLLLLGRSSRVLNPATRRWAHVPPCPEDSNDYCDECHLLFDPSLSPHFQVLRFQSADDYQDQQGGESETMEWPPSPYVMWLYSSATGRWEKKPFARQGGCAAGTLAEVRSANDPDPEFLYSVYCRGALYAHCKSDFVIRITTSDCKYQVIKPPEVLSAGLDDHVPRLAKSRSGVCLASKRGSDLRVWFLHESAGCETTEWVLKYHVDLAAVDSHFSSRNYPNLQIDRQWTLHRVDDYKNAGRLTSSKRNIQWNFDCGNIVKIKAAEDEASRAWREIYILGFHPYKDVAFLHLTHDRVVAYHLDSSKVQDLGHFCIHFQGGRNEAGKAFVYSPCWMGELTEHN